MRRVVDTDMVAHLWANQSQDEARNPRGNLFFRGDTIYSYGFHFPIARIITRKGGTRAVLFNPASYSNTTAKHQRIVRGACRHQIRFDVPSGLSGPPDHKTNLRHYREQIAAATLAAGRARRHAEWKLNQLGELVAEANRYAAYFGLRTRFPAPGGPEIEAAVERSKVADEKARERREARDAKAKAEFATALERWKAGEDVRWLSWPGWDIYLRIRDRDGERIVETSRGAEVPYLQAIRLLPLIRSGRPYAHAGHSLRVGSFTVDEITAGGDIRAGCHYIKRAELERLATELGLTDADATGPEERDAGNPGLEGGRSDVPSADILPGSAEVSSEG